MPVLVLTRAPKGTYEALRFLAWQVMFVLGAVEDSTSDMQSCLKHLHD